MKSAHFNGWSDLTPFGINYLTGESCAYGLRILCDLSEQGVSIMREFLSADSFSQSWNSRVGDAPAVASVMLTRSVFRDLALFISFHVLKHSFAVVGTGGTVDSYSDEFLVEHKIDRETAREHFLGSWYNNPVQYSKTPSIGGRSVHAFTERAA